MACNRNYVWALRDFILFCRSIIRKDSYFLEIDRHRQSLLEEEI